MSRWYSPTRHPLVTLVRRTDAAFAARASRNAAVALAADRRRARAWSAAWAEVDHPPVPLVTPA